MLQVGHEDSHPDEPVTAAPAADTAVAGRSVESQWLLARASERLLGASAPAVLRVGRYRILRRIGAGGMSLVYCAWDDALGREIAIKLLQSNLARTRQWREQLRREGQAMARLAHANVVHVYEVGVHEDQPFIAMELVRGVSLRQWAHAATRSTDEIVAMHLQAARGLAAAHAAGLVHRDYKPDNVLVDESGCARVLDFGLVHVGEALPTWSSGEHALAVDDERATLAGDVVGTPPYMAPEQLDGGSVDARSDQFGFCVSLFEALHGRRPFPGRTPAELRAAIAAGVESTRTRADDPDLAAIDAVLRRGLSRDPADRFADMDALVAALERARTARRQAARLELERRARTLDLFSRSDLRLRHVVLVGAILMAMVAALTIARRYGVYEIGYAEATACGAAFVVMQAVLERRQRRRSPSEHDERWSRAVVVGTAMIVSSLPLAWLAGLSLTYGLLLLTFGFACSIGVIGLMTDVRVLPASVMLLLTAFALARWPEHRGVVLLIGLALAYAVLPLAHRIARARAPDQPG
ncbi:MAG: serine/threonine protein kinase [Nannocystaceae bacterium]|nr:serine/threonine protein kinase [Nannocystaceae bacterium]